MDQYSSAPNFSTDHLDNKKQKQFKILIITSIIIGLIGISFGIFSIIQNIDKDKQISNLKKQAESSSRNDIDKSKTENSQDNSQSQNSNQPNNNQSSNTKNTKEEIEVNSIIEKINDAINTQLGAKFNKTHNGFLPTFQIPNTDIFTNLEKSFSLDPGTLLENKDFSNKIYNLKQAIKAVLKHNGYVAKNGPSEFPFYYNESSQIICEVQELSDPLVGCGSIKWLSEERKQLVLELSRVSKVKYLNLSAAKIINSKITPYQRMIIGGFANHLFYRNSSNSKWQFVQSTQSLFACDNFNNDAKKAYAGETCWDNSTNSEKTL